MKRIACALLALILLFAAFSMTSCGKDDGAPEGMALVKGGDDLGYYFWGPEEWVVANIGDIACTYVSKVDLSSMTFVEAELPEGTVSEYFEDEKAKFPYEIKVTVDGKDCTFGTAKTAKKYVYTYTYKEVSYTCMQIFVTHAECFYIFTYTASNVEHSEGTSFYDRYLEKVTATIDAFVFTDKVPSIEEAPVYERDEDGYILVTNKTLTGFDMYVPEAYKVDHSSVMISVSREDGTNITMAQATYTGVSHRDYWEARKKNIGAFADKVTDKDGNLVSSLVEKEIEKQISLPGTNWALAYEYTYVFEGVTYHVYQVLIVESSINGYVFTYTATEENYLKHLTEMESVLRKIDY